MDKQQHSNQSAQSNSGQHPIDQEFQDLRNPSEHKLGFEQDWNAFQLSYGVPTPSFWSKSWVKLTSAASVLIGISSIVPEI